MTETAQKENNKFILTLMAGLLLIASLFMMGTANLSEIFALMQEIVDNTPTIIGLVIMGITISIAVGIGVWVKKLLNKAIQ